MTPISLATPTSLSKCDTLMSYCAVCVDFTTQCAIFSLVHVPYPPSYPTVPRPLSLGLLNGGEGVWEYHWEGSLTGGWALLRYWKTVLAGKVQLCSYVALFPGFPRFLFSSLFFFLRFAFSINTDTDVLYWTLSSLLVWQSVEIKHFSVR